MKQYWILLGIVGGAVGIGLIAASALNSSNGAATTAADETGPTSVSVSQTTLDLGSMKVSDERSDEVVITNTGDAPLKLSRVRTSCGCTLAALTINDRTMTFSMEMHNPVGLRSWVGEVAPGASATLRAIYRPYVMPVQGLVERKIWFDTNDPEQKTVEITVRANVQ